MKRTLSTLLISVLLFPAYAQKGKFGKINKEEIISSYHEIEKDSKAAILYSESKSYLEYNKGSDRFEMRTEVYKKIKIYSDDARDLGNVFVYLRKSEGDKEKIKDIKAIAHNIQNGNLKKSKMEKSAVFEEDYSRFRNRIKFVIPNVKKGSVIEYKYTIQSPFLWEIPRWYFQSEHPTNESHFYAEIPEYYNFKTTSTGSFPLDVVTEQGMESITMKSRNLSQSEKTLQGLKNRQNDKSGRNRTNQTVQFNYKKEKKHISAINVPSLKNASYVTNINTYRSSVAHELLFTSFPEQQIKYYTSTWSDIGNVFMESSDFGGQFGKVPAEYNSYLANLAVEPELLKAKTIFYKVQQEFNWDNTYGVFLNQKIKNLIKTKSGSIAEINLLMYNLMSKAGLNVSPVCTKIRSEGFLNTAYPTVSDLSYVILKLNIEDKEYFLDATDKLVAFGELPLRAINMSGVNISHNVGEAILVKNPNSATSSYVIDGAIDQNGFINATTNTKLQGVAAYDFRSKAGEKSINNGRKYESIELENVENLEKPISIKEQVVIEDAIEKINNKLYINPILDMKIEAPDFVSDTREFPVFFPNKFSKIIYATIKIPEDYTVEFLPEPISISVEGSVAAFKYLVSETDGVLKISYREQIKTDIILPENYASLKLFFEQLKSKCSEKIVLVRN